MVHENMKKHNEDDVDYSLMCRLRLYLGKLENYVMKSSSIVLTASAKRHLLSMKSIKMSGQSKEQATIS